MKTFEKWLDKTNYKYNVLNKQDSTEYRVSGKEGCCLVVFNHAKNRGCLVYDDYGYMRPCKNVKDTIELVDLLSGGIC